MALKDMGEMLLREEPFSEIVMGDTAIVRAMVEAGVRVASSYPGSPTPEIAEAIASIPHERRPFYFEFSTNEKVALEVAFGASINGHLSCCFFKSVGLNVAADSFVQLSMMNLLGGMVIVLGDDPGANSSQNEQDNRHLARLAYVPVFEPASPKESYEMFLEAAKLSKEHNMPVIVRLTTHVCHAKEKVRFGRWKPKPLDPTPRFDPKSGSYIPLTAATVYPMKRRALENVERLREYAEFSPFNLFVKNDNNRRGIITAGLPFLSLMDVLQFADEKPDILKLGMAYPLPRKLVADFLASHDEVKVLEELDNFIEVEVKSIAFDSGIKSRIIGKKDLEDWVGEYVPEKVYSVMKKTWPDMLPDMDFSPKGPMPSPRPPQLCPGCGHRSAFYAIKRALKDTDITVADIGCHTLGYLDPHEMGQVLLCMGHSTGTGSGLSLFNDERKVVAFIGDSTLFHAGLPGIINAVFNRHNLTLVIMENGTTAMTGHQDHPGSGKNFNGPTDAISIKKMLEGLGVKSIRVVDAYSQQKLTEAVREAVSEEGFSVVIASHPCMLKFTREQRRKGKLTKRQVSVDQEKCKRIYECVKAFACPSFQLKDDGSVEVSEELCIGDGSCVQTCPVKALRYED